VVAIEHFNSRFWARWCVCTLALLLLVPSVKFGIPIASAAPIFWCWHSFVDHIYWDWQRCTVPCPDVIGSHLEIGKRKLKAAGLKVGCITSVPGYTVTEKCGPSYKDDDPSRFAHPAGHTHGGSEGNGGHTHEAEHLAGRSGHKRSETPEPSPEFLHPRPDYSYLTSGPRIVAQYPSPFVTAKTGSAVSLTIG